MTLQDVVFLFDVDNTLVDNDRIQHDLRKHLERESGPENRDRYWAIFEQLRTELGYADYLGALQRYRLGAMSLIRGIDSSPMKQKLLRSIVSLCRDLGIEIIAEGVETEAERDALITVGGDLCQGYLFGRPEKPWTAIRF